MSLLKECAYLHWRGRETGSVWPSCAGSNQVAHCSSILLRHAGYPLVDRPLLFDSESVRDAWIYEGN